MARLFQHDHMLELAKYASVPVINGLTNESHPCQILTDIFTFQEIRGKIEGKTVVFFGVANNIFKSL